MLARITGIAEEIDAQTNTVLLAVGDLCYEVMVPAYAVSDLTEQTGRSVTVHCMEYYEAGGLGGNLIPRLIGFPQNRDKAFFQRFTSVKGIGARKALRALARPPADIASSIESGDTQMLATLPEIGKRTAERIVAELKGKMGDYALAETSGAHAEATPLSAIEREALEILLQLGERRAEAEELISAVAHTCDDIQTTDALVQAVYRMKSGSL